MYTIEQIQQLTGGRWLRHDIPGFPVTHFVYDSRQASHHEAGLFLAFPGTNHDGHHFIPDAYQKGVRNFLLSNPDFPVPPTANAIHVKDTLKALQKLAVYHRQRYASLPVIGITGSTGKTTVKEWLYEMLTPEMHVVKNPRSFNSSLGVPLSVLRITGHHEMAIFEAGPGGPGQMEPLAAMIRCNTGIFANIGDAHSAQYPDMRSKVKEKMKLFREAKTLIYCKDHRLIAAEIQTSFEGKPFSWSRREGADIWLKNIVNDAFEHSSLELVYQGEKLIFNLPARDPASIENAMHVIATLLFLEKSPEYIRENLQKLPRLQMRLELKSGIHNCLILNDSYSADWDSFQLALNFLQQQETKPDRTLILTDFIASENHSGSLYKKMADAINDVRPKRVIAVGDEIKATLPHLSPDISYLNFPDTDALLTRIDEGSIVFHDETVLLKGARSFHLERVADRLIERTHNTILEVDMYALAKNLKVYTHLLRPDTKIMVMVKANAYGAGSVEISRMLEYHGVNYLAVAYADEAIELRKNGIRTRIMILNPEVPQFMNYLRYQLEPEISSPRLLDKWIAFCEGAGQWPAFHLKLETGMNRLGFDVAGMPVLLERLEQYPKLRVASVFSHLAASGEAEHDNYTREQFDIFEKNYGNIATVLGYRPVRHILNSAGIIRFPSYHYEMVRLGAGLYGIDSYLPFRDKIHSVLALKSRISQIKYIAAGQSVGYSRKYIAKKDMRIAVISIGYGDGIPRAVSNGKYAFLIHGKRATILGAVAMDMCMVDITDIPEAREEDIVEIFGKNLPVQELADAAGTISYEIFTSISDRVKRIYFY